MIKQYKYTSSVLSPIENLIGDIERLDLSKYNIEKIPDYKFKNASAYTNLTEVILPSSVTSIGEDAFYGCSSLTNINIPDNVTTIGKTAFYGCSSLSTVRIPVSVEKISSSAFMFCNNLILLCDAEERPSGWDFYWSRDIPVYWGTSVEKQKDNFRYILNNNTLFLARYSGSDTNVTIPNTIYDNTQYYTVKAVGNYAFLENKTIERVSFPTSIKTIGDYAFYGCSNLRVEISDGVKEIGNYAFYGTILIAKIPVSVKKIGDYAFYGASASNATITYTGTKAQWNQITFGDSWYPTGSSSGLLWVNCTDGTITIDTNN